LNSIYKAFFKSQEGKGGKDKICKKFLKGNFLDLVTNTKTIDFLKRVRKDLDVILKGLPSNLVQLQNDYKSDFPSFYKKSKEKQEDFKVILNVIFNYTGMFSLNVITEEIKGIPYLDANKDTKRWNRYNFVDSLGINTCCYCNRQYITTVIEGKSGKGIIGPSLDHVFDKSSYPIFALSFYNLVPACSNCNTLKGNKDFMSDYLHPYEAGFKGDAVFKYDGNVDVLYGRMLPDRLYIKNSKNTGGNSKKIKKNIKSFKLDKIYPTHADIVEELIWKRIASSDRYLENLIDTYDELKLSYESAKAYRFAFSNYKDESDFHKRPLAKMTYDIAKQLGLI
jgi:hypothetical protein